jgi:hypothetical protein
MNTATRALGIIVASSLLAACGGGGSGTTPSPKPAPSSQSVANKANASASITIKFPAHVGHAVPGQVKGASAARRAPKYVNPNPAFVFVFYLNGNAITNPATGTPNFSTGAFAPDGSATITVPLASGVYTPDSLGVAEMTSDELTLISYGQNESYTDSTGSFQDGSFALASGGTASVQMTTAMNVGGVVMTTDPVSGSDAVVLSQNSGSPTCFNPPNGSRVYLFAADATGTFVLGAAGYGGGDGNNPYPGVPLATLLTQSTVAFPSTSKLAATAAPESYVVVYDGGLTDILARFVITNPQSNVNGNAFGVPSQIFGYVEIGSGCT